jgi:hypothetical protein
MVSENGVMMQVKRQSSWISNLSFYSELPRMQDRTYTLGQFTRMLQEKLEAAGLDAGQIGYDSKTPHLAELATLLPRISLSSVSSELAALRWVKHPEEIAILQAAATLGGWPSTNSGQPQTRPRLAELSAHGAGHGEAGRRYPGSISVLKLLTLSGPAFRPPTATAPPTGATVDANSPIVSVIVPRMNGYSVEVHHFRLRQAERRAEGAVRDHPRTQRKRHQPGICEKPRLENRRSDARPPRRTLQLPCASLATVSAFRRTNTRRCTGQSAQHRETRFLA